jgi:hypothetical protein
VTALGRALARRFGADYQIVASADAAAALDALGRAGVQVGLMLAGQWLQGMPGVQFLCQAHELHPAAKRPLLTRVPSAEVTSQASATYPLDSRRIEVIRASSPSARSSFRRASHLAIAATGSAWGSVTSTVYTAAGRRDSRAAAVAQASAGELARLPG